MPTGDAMGARGYYYPGIRRTTALVQNRFWWSSLSQDVQEFVDTCVACA